MDKIQKALIKLGHKDLADEYYQKIALNLIPSKKEQETKKEVDRLSMMALKSFPNRNQLKKMKSDLKRAGVSSLLEKEFNKIEKKLIDFYEKVGSSFESSLTSEY